MGGGGYDASQKVWVGNLPDEAADEDLDAHFRQLSEPVSAHIFRKGQGCIVYESSEEAEMAISAFNGSEIGGAIISTDSWSAKMPQKGAGKSAGGKGKAAGGKGAFGNGKGGGKYSSGAKGGGGNVVGGAKGWGKDRGGYGAPMPSKYPTAPVAWAGGPIKPVMPEKWTPPPVGNTVVHWIRLPDHASLLAQGLPPDAPAIMYEKGDSVFSSASHVLYDFIPDIAAEVELVHDTEGDKYPEVSEVIRDAVGEDICFVVATCASKATWAVGLANGWKGRETSAKLALALALASQDPDKMATAARNNPDFGVLCRKQGLMTGAPAPVAGPKVAKSLGGAYAAAAQSPQDDIPPIHFISVEGSSKIMEAGLPAEAPAIVFTKAQKEYFSSAHSILCEFVEDPKEEVSFEDDADCEVFPEVSAACVAAGAEENGICVASHPELGAWGVGMGPGHEGRMRAAKLALGLAICQNQNKIEEFAQNYPEFGTMLANVGLVEPQAKKRRKGGGKW